ncbi:translation initiation factor IF-2 [bacterium]|nr:translation initiation factor IF-2 [Chloroflexi bacterium CFX6]RIL08256.1 MAG: translation initiation factor IF-2 [bacterium]
MASQVKERKVVEIPASIAVRDLADKLDVSPVALLKRLIANGVMASITQTVDFDTAAIVAEDVGVTLRLEGSSPAPSAAVAAPAEAPALPGEEPAPPGIPWYLVGEAEDKLVVRPPVVTVMGHVDHGKTSLLDAIRNTRVAAGESGGITQHVGAYTVERAGGRITFIDTPGHQAFSAMRARGAQATDIAVIVVAADDGVMPQTREAIDHAKAAGVPIIVAVNKIDLAGARPERVMEQLAEIDLVPEAWGGDTFFIPVSAVTGQGLEDLLDAIVLVSEEHPARANPGRPALGVVLEGRIDQQRGVIADILVQSGTLHAADTLVVGTAYGKVRAMFGERGERVKEAGPSTPVEIMGLSAVPDAGARFEVVANEKTAKAIVAARAADTHARAVQVTAKPMTLDELFAKAEAGEAKTLNIVVKTDVQGTLDPVVTALEQCSGPIRVNVLRAANGDITEWDVNLAAASNAIVIGFRVSPDNAALQAATAQHVEIREYDVIYKMIEDISDALTGMLEPKYVEKTIGRAEVRAVFSISKQGNIAGSSVTGGVIRRNATVRVLRGGAEIAQSAVASLKRFTEDVREVREGFECGIGLASFDDFKEGDILEFFVRERAR